MLRSISEIKMKKYAFYCRPGENATDKHGFTVYDYYDFLSDVWCAETCAPRMRKEWCAENRTLGQCSVTAFLIQDIFGGKVLGVPLDDGNFHCFNVIGGGIYDLTSEQFGDEILDYENCPEQLRSTHFAKEEKKKRYELLKSRLEERIKTAVSG